MWTGSQQGRARAAATRLGICLHPSPQQSRRWAVLAPRGGGAVRDPSAGFPLIQPRVCSGTQGTFPIAGIPHSTPTRIPQGRLGCSLPHIGPLPAQPRAATRPTGASTQNCREGFLFLAPSRAVSQLSVCDGLWRTPASPWPRTAATPPAPTPRPIRPRL